MSEGEIISQVHRIYFKTGKKKGLIKIKQTERAIEISKGEDVREKGKGEKKNYDGGSKESLTFTGYDVYVQTGGKDCHTSLNFRGGFCGSQCAKVPT